LIVAQASLLLLFGLAAWAFAWRSPDYEEDDVLVRALAIGAVLAASSRLCFLLYPSSLISLVHVGDVFRLGFYVVLAGGAAARIQRYWTAEAEAVAFQTRERVAREIHDGLTQELGFIASHAASLASGRGDPGQVDHVAMAAQRAQHESRRIIDALEGAAPRRLEGVLRQAVGPVADRHGATVAMEIDPALVLNAGITHEISQIAREATSNAVRHGGATTIAIRVGVSEGEVRLTLADDGEGFDRGAIDRSGFGLRSMEQRAIQLGGALVIRSDPGQGATVELVAPVSDDRSVRLVRNDGRVRPSRRARS
jgi:signal transduction histidine kinase